MTSPTILRLLAATTLSLSTALSAQQPEPPAPDAQPKPVPSPTPQVTADDSTQKNESAERDGKTSRSEVLSAPGHDGMVNRRIAGLLRLQEQMHEKLDLSTDQRKKIDQKFDDYFIGIMNPAHKPHAVPEPENIAMPNELPKLLIEMDAAKKEGNEQVIFALRQKINCAKSILEPSVIDSPFLFIDYLMVDLDEEQKAKLHEIVESWRALRVRDVVPDDPYKRLIRSIRDKSLDIPEDTRTEWIKEMAKDFRNLRQSNQFNPTTLAELTEKWKVKLSERMDTEQLQHVKKTHEMLERWAREDEKAVAETRKRLEKAEPSGGLRLEKLLKPVAPGTAP